MNRAWRLAACAALVPAAMPGEAQPPVPAPISDEQVYKDAMECKVRVEALEMAARGSRERKRLGRALAYWVEQERAAGVRLGKTPAGMMADETIFGFGEGSNPDSLGRAIGCAQRAERESADR